MKGMMYMMAGISDDCVKDIRERMYLILDTYGNLSYDYHHIRRVEAECSGLATLRGLNKNIAEIIGLLHDTGRIIGQVSGKNHSKESGRIASIWLKEYPIDDIASDTIIRAVTMHNHKKRIGSPYEELIKDADSLAHGIEFPNDLSVHEALRIKTSKLPPLQFGLIPITQVEKLLQSNIEALLRTFVSLNPNNISGSEVHALRVKIRSIRSIFSLLRGTKQWDVYKSLNKDMRIIFKLFETSRKLTVFRKSLKAVGIRKKGYKQITKDIDRENEAALSELAKYRKRISRSLKGIRVDALPEKSMESNFSLKVDQYKRGLVTSDVKSMENIHDIRIKGKLLKYLLDDQIVTLNQKKTASDLSEDLEDMNLINDLHNCMGKLHDLEENERLYVTYFESNKNHLSKENKLLLKQLYTNQKKHERKKLKVLIFHMRKRVCQ